MAKQKNSLVSLLVRRAMRITNPRVFLISFCRPLLILVSSEFINQSDQREIKPEISWILLDRFDTKLECEEARDERAARLVKQNAFDGQYVLTCYPDSFDPRKVVTNMPPKS